MKDPIIAKIDELEHRSLEHVTALPFDPARILGTQGFVRLRGLADFWSTHPEVDFGQYITDMFISAHSLSGKFHTVVLVGTPQRFAVYLSLGTPEMTRAFVEGVFPGGRLEYDPATKEPLVTTNLASQLTPHLYEQGMISGIPSRKTAGASSANATKAQGGVNGAKREDDGASGGATESQGLSHMERIVRGMSGTTWAYIVRAFPRPQETVAQERLNIIDELAHFSPLMRGQMQKNIQHGETLNPAGNRSFSETISGEIINYRAQYLVQSLERELARLDRALAVGQWTVDTYFGAATPADAQRLAALLVGTLAGKDSRPYPLRSHVCENTHRSLQLDMFKTYLSSEELGILVQFPREEVPGYAIHDFARFDVDFPIPTTATLELGAIQQNDKDTHEQYRIALDDLTKHATVLGVTGSGKTTTILNLLDHAVRAGKPFLVIEPAKTEYRPLRRAMASLTDVRVYTLGNEMVAPFRFNPFEFETDDRVGSGSVLSHVDFLKTVFNAAFVLYAPMPYVLETALHEIYEDKGWDLASGRNLRLPDSDWTRRHAYPLFPMLTDLYRKIEEVTLRLNYHGELEQNVIAGLKARIGSLRLGSKGFMLDTAHGISLSELLSRPTILELEHIGNDDEKTFLMGLLLARLYEYRRLQAARGPLPAGLQHLLVFEEAHRLLKQTQTQVDSESANPRAQAIETFTNMLSEVRGYGQGVIVAEQIPSKLAPDVLKNTNLKVAHRLVAQDDRRSVGQTMNLSDTQMTHLGTLLPGRAAMYAEGADHAYLVRMENYKHASTFLYTSDALLESESKKYIFLDTYLTMPNIKVHGVKCPHFNGPDMAIYQAAGLILETRECKQWWASILLCTVFHRSKLLFLLDQLSQLLVATTSMHRIQSTQHDVLQLMVLVRGTAEILNERGAEVGWGYPLVEKLRQSLTLGLTKLLQTRNSTLAASDLDAFSLHYKMNLKQKQGPFAGCKHCTAICTYHLEVKRILSGDDMRWIDETLETVVKSPYPRNYKPLADMADAIGEQWLEGSNVLASAIGYCGVLHTLPRLNIPLRTQAIIADELSKILL